MSPLCLKNRLLSRELFTKLNADIFQTQCSSDGFVTQQNIRIKWIFETDIPCRYGLHDWWYAFRNKKRARQQQLGVVHRRCINSRLYAIIVGIKLTALFEFRENVTIQNAVNRTRWKSQAHETDTALDSTADQIRRQLRKSLLTTKNSYHQIR